MISFRPTYGLHNYGYSLQLDLGLLERKSPEPQTDYVRILESAEKGVFNTDSDYFNSLLGGDLSNRRSLY